MQGFFQTVRKFLGKKVRNYEDLTRDVTIASENIDATFMFMSIKMQ